MSSVDEQHVDRIRYQMRRIRHHLDDDVTGLLSHAHQLTDWKYYLRRFPWAVLGSAAAAAFLLVPRKQLPAQQVTLDSAAARQLEAINAKLGEGTSVPKPTLIKSMALMAASTLLRSGMVYLGEQIRSGNFALRFPPGTVRQPFPETPPERHSNPFESTTD